MKLYTVFSSIAILTIASAHCVLPASPNPSYQEQIVVEESLFVPGSRILAFCSHEDKKNEISITKIETYPDVPATGDTVHGRIIGRQRGVFGPGAYVIFRDSKTRRKLNIEPVDFCKFLKTTGRDCHYPTGVFDLRFEFKVRPLPGLTTMMVDLELYSRYDRRITCLRAPVIDRLWMEE